MIQANKAQIPLVLLRVFREKKSRIDYWLPKRPSDTSLEGKVLALITENDL